MLKIVTAPNAVLSQKAEGVKKVTKEIIELIEEMKQTLLSTKDPIGVGLAAPQVGRALRIFVIKPTEKASIQTFINPEVLTRKNANQNAKQHGKASVDQRTVPHSSAKTNRLEGCLSLPTIWGTVKRQKQIMLSYLDRQGKPHTRIFEGFSAIIIQHEIDHLDGILFPKRVLEQKARLPSGQGKLYKSHKNEEGEDEFEEIEL